MSLTCFGQDSLSIDTRQTNGVDSIHASHTTFSSNTLEDATKAEGDSAYIKEDYAAAIQIYEALLKNGEMLWKESGVHDVNTLTELLKRFQ